MPITLFVMFLQSMTHNPKLLIFEALPEIWRLNFTLKSVAPFSYKVFTCILELYLQFRSLKFTYFHNIIETICVAKTWHCFFSPDGNQLRDWWEFFVRPRFSTSQVTVNMIRGATCGVILFTVGLFVCL